MKEQKKSGWPLSSLILALAAVCAFIVAHYCVNQTELKVPKNMGSEEYSVLPNENALIWMSMGQREFVADLIWIRALQYNTLRDEAHLADHFADAIIALDPDFKAVYRWAAVTSVFRTEITRDAVMRANAYLAQGAKRFPLDPYYDYSTAINLISYFPGETKEERSENRKKAIAHLQLSMQKPGAEPQIAMLISGLLNGEDDLSAKITFIQQAILTETDPETKRHLQMRLVALSESSDSSALMLSERRDQWQREHHPYMPIMLDYMLSGGDAESER